jgi:hypothetical protein
MPQHPTADMLGGAYIVGQPTSWDQNVSDLGTHISRTKDPALLSGQINILRGEQALRNPFLAHSGLLHWLHQIIMLGTGASNWVMRQPCSSAFKYCRRMLSLELAVGG